jgi:YesN/AraC family two-component response regulator
MYLSKAWGGWHMYENYTVLFVDDEVNILSALRRNFMDEEFTTYFANSGKEALEIMKEHEVHVIVTDMRMPEMTGLQLLKIVNEQYPMTVKVVLSGYTQLPQILATINQVDIFKFITKPWENDDMELVIKKSLDFYMLKEENQKQKKALELKNQTYQNMLRQMDTLTLEGKRGTIILGNCGKAIFSFMKNYALKDRMNIHTLLDLQDKIFSLLVEAALEDKKKSTFQEIVDMTQSVNRKVMRSIQVNDTSEDSYKYDIYLPMLKASMLILLLLFELEFQANNLMLKVSHNKQEFQITMLSPNKNYIPTNQSMIEMKIELANKVIYEALKESNLSFQIYSKSENIVIGFSYKEESGK